MKINTTHFNRKKNRSVYFYQGYIYCTNIYLSPCFLHDVVMNLWYKTRMEGPIIDCVPFYDDIKNLMVPIVFIEFAYK